MASLLAFISCGSNRNRQSLRLGKDTSFQSSDKKLFSKLNSNISSKAHSMVKMISWRKVQSESDQEVDDDHDVEADSDKAVWRKTIMMGERCRPLDFSGTIIYDSQGNLLPDSANHDRRNNYHVH